MLGEIREYVASAEQELAELRERRQLLELKIAELERGLYQARRREGEILSKRT